MIDAKLVQQLLYEEESSTLDFKQQQYAFSGEDDRKKAELLKDILAFANAWRRSDAFILLGVAEVRGGRSAIEISGLQVGIIHIPVQERPFYLKRKYGHLESNTVYLRRGSSTDIAAPDEIARIGQESSSTSQVRSPALSGSLVTGQYQEQKEKSVEIETVCVHIPEKSDFPAYGMQYMQLGSKSVPMHTGSLKNRDYYYERAEYFQKKKCGPTLLGRCGKFGKFGSP